jgi:broad specificity phosphatase PhoE
LTRSAADPTVAAHFTTREIGDCRLSPSRQRNMAARLTFLCHGSTRALRAAAFAGDEELDDRGLAGAAALVGKLPSVERCWTSPELRARQTAQALGREAIVAPELCDCDYGAWKGRGFDEVWGEDPEAATKWLRDPEAAPHGGETLANLMRRVAAWLDAQREVSGAALVVTHASVIRAAIVHAIEANPRSFWRIDVAPLSQARFSGNDGRWNLAELSPAPPKR